MDTCYLATQASTDAIKQREAYKLNEAAHNTDVQGDQFGYLRREL